MEKPRTARLLHQLSVLTYLRIAIDLNHIPIKAKFFFARNTLWARSPSSSPTPKLPMQKHRPGHDSVISQSVLLYWSLCDQGSS